MCLVSLSVAAQKIEDVLAKARACISSNLIQFHLEDENEREKNELFMQKYLISHNDRIKIINELTYRNATEMIAERIKDAKKYGTLYVFGIEKNLIEKETGNIKNVPIYIKFQFFDFKNIKDAALVISFHEAKDEIVYFSWSNT